MDETTQEFLSVRDLEMIYTSDGETVHAANGISSDIGRGETLALVDETGAGKATIARAILEILLNPPARLRQGRVILKGGDLLKKPAEETLRIHDGKITMTFQDPMMVSNPAMTVGEQVVEGLLLYNNYTRRETEEKAGRMLELVGIPAERSTEYPFEFSGGMKQRVVIAMALAYGPGLLLADEPTTALDVTIQAQVLDLIKDLKVKYNTPILLIIHDRGVVTETNDRAVVIYAGEILEYGNREDVLLHPSYLHAVGLFHPLPGMNSRVRRLEPIAGSPPDPTDLPGGCTFAPRRSRARGGCSKGKTEFRKIAPGHFCRCGLKQEEDQYMPSPIEVRHLKKYFKVPAGANHMVDDTSFSIEKGETLGVVGESGCGKSTLGRILIRLQKATEGEIPLNGTDIAHARGGELRTVREQVQIVFQGPYSSLNLRIRIKSIIMEPLKRSGRPHSRPELRDEANRLIDLVGVDERLRHSYSHELDGGHRQKVGIARVLALGPEFIVCDEPVNVLDISTQAQTLNLLIDLQEKSGAAYMFITHDLPMVRHISDSIRVMYLGQLVERAPSAELFVHTLYPYTKALLSVIPFTDILHPTKRLPLKGGIASPINPKPDCRFYPRCPYAAEACKQPQGLTEILGHHLVSCYRVSETNG